MATSRMNVLVYSGTGTTIESVRHCLYSLRRLLSANYAVSAVTSDTLLREPWQASCALLVFPGGADLGYCRTFNGDGNRRIKQYVNAGGSYLGLCAGGYYGSKECEFQVGDDKLEVIGDRELGFFPGICRGSAFSGFAYNSESGTKATELKVERNPFTSSGGNVPELFRSYFNGGSVFVDAEKYSDSGVEILASYTGKLDVDPGQGAAAVVFCKVGDGKVVLTGPHPEFAAVNLSKEAKGMKPDVVDAIAQDDKPRKDFLKACLSKLGLNVNQAEEDIPSLSKIHLSSGKGSEVTRILEAWEPAVTLVDGEKYIHDASDTFHLEDSSSAWSIAKLADTVASALPSLSSSKINDKAEAEVTDNPDQALDYNEVIKKIVAHQEPPFAKSTPYFNHQALFTHLAKYNNVDLSVDTGRTIFGRTLLYGEVVTSTSTLLEKNQKLTAALPTGTTFTATTQLSGRGRGSNVWISPAGQLIFSFVMRHALSLNSSAPVVFIQYLAALAVAEAVRTYDSTASPLLALRRNTTTPKSSYARVPVKLKWPNDIYALDPKKQTAKSSQGDTVQDRNAYSKIGGILVNSSYTDGEFTLVVGIGINTSNAAPTTSLNALISHLNEVTQSQRQGSSAAELPPYTLEKLLARILSCFQAFYEYFCLHGFAGELENLYYTHWLHEAQVVTLETEGGTKAQIRGITTDWGMLLAEEVSEVGDTRDGTRKTVGNGKKFALQSDNNSFDFFNGLIRRKI